MSEISNREWRVGKFRAEGGKEGGSSEMANVSRAAFSTGIYWACGRVVPRFDPELL